MAYDSPAEVANVGDDGFLEKARDRMRIAIEATQANRVFQLEDVKFAAASPDNQWQWPAEVIAMRAAKDGSPARPTLTINKLPQHIRLVTNEQRQNRPSIKVLPVDDKADEEVAEVLNGIIRHIESNSNADVAYDTAGENQVTHGEGYWRILTDYCDEMSFDQDIYIVPVKNSFSVYMDPDGLKKDSTGRYIEWCFITDEMSKDEFKKQFPKAECTNWDVLGKGDGGSDWVLGENIRIAEYFCFHDEKKKIVQWSDGSVTMDGEMPKLPLMPMIGPDGKQVSRETTIRKIKWTKMTGFEKLEEKEWAGKFIPVVRVVGNEWEVDGKMVVSGLVRNAKDACRMFNYWTSQEAELLALAPKAPFMAPIEAIEGFESFYKTANVVNHSYLPYNAFNEAGEPIPAPARSMPPQPSAGIVQAKLAAADDIQSTVGQYNPSLGAEADEKSGKAIMARQRQADVGTYHFIDNQARAIRQTGRILIDLIPKYYDTRRVARILGEDGEPDHVTIDPDQQAPTVEVTTSEGAIEKIYNPSIGQYDVRVTVGPSYTTKRQEAAEFMAQVLTGNKELMGVIGDLYFGMLDVPGAEEIQKRLKKTIPANLLDEDEEKPQEPIIPTPQGPVPASQIPAMLEQMQAELEQAAKAVQAAGDIEAEAQKLEKIKAEIQSMIDQFEANKELAALQDELRQKNIEMEQMTLQADKDRAVADIQKLEEQVQLKLEQTTQKANETKTASDAIASVQEQINALQEGLKQVFKVASAKRKTTIEYGPDGEPLSSTSVPVFDDDRQETA